MIGFNNKGFAGKTPEEKAELAEAERLDRIQSQYVNDFTVWAEHIERAAKLTARTANRINNFAYLKFGIYAPYAPYHY